MHAEAKSTIITNEHTSLEKYTAQPGVLSAQALCWELVLTAFNCNSYFNCNWLQLTRTLYGIGLYNCLTSTCFLWASHLHRLQPVHGQGYILIFSTGCTCFSIDSWVEGQYVTKMPMAAKQIMNNNNIWLMDGTLFSTSVLLRVNSDVLATLWPYIHQLSLTGISVSHIVQCQTQDVFFFIFFFFVLAGCYPTKEDVF